MTRLDRFGREQSSHDIRVADKGPALGNLPQISARRMGFPLFVEELTKSVLESGLPEVQVINYHRRPTSALRFPQRSWSLTAR